MSNGKILACAFSACPPGTAGFIGGEDILGWSLLSQISRFHEVWALTEAGNKSSIEEGLKEEPNANLHFRYVSLPSWLRPLLKYQGGHQFYYYLWQIRVYFAARKLHNQISFALFHHITYANDWIASFIGALLPIPYIRGPGGGAHRTPPGFEKEYRFFSRIWEKVRGPAQWVFRHDPFFVKGQNRARAILVCNKESHSNIPQKWSHKVHLFPVNGVTSSDLSMATPQEPSSGNFRVLTAGSLIRVKGFGLAIKAFNRFASEHPEATFSIIGSGPEELRLRKLVRKSDLDDQVLFIPAVPRHELLSMMASHDVFLFPSLRDGGGAVVIEAMSAGKPVVCLDTGGPGMHVTDECGMKIAPGTYDCAPELLAQALDRLYLDKSLRESLGRAARERVEKHYHWNRLGERLIGIYQQALDSPIPA